VCRATLPLLINELPLITEWRTFSIASSSFPADMSDVKRNSIKELEREEWAAWLSLRSKSNVKRMPTYSDYGINHPVMESFNPFLMQAYTLKEVVIDGQTRMVKVYPPAS